MNQTKQELLEEIENIHRKLDDIYANLRPSGLREKAKRKRLEVYLSMLKKRYQKALGHSASGTRSALKEVPQAINTQYWL